MAAPDQLARRQIPLAIRAPSIHGTQRNLSCSAQVGGYQTLSSRSWSDVCFSIDFVGRTPGSGREREQRKLAADVKGCGRRPLTDAATHTGAGVGKPPEKEPAGGRALSVPQTLWGFGSWRRYVEVEPMRSGAVIGVSGKRVSALPGAKSAKD